MNKYSSLKRAKQIFKKNLRYIKNKENREFLIIHSKSVIKTALILAEGKNIDKEVLEIAGWIHDLGYSISQENHAKHSLEIIKKENFAISEKLKDCILNHGSDGDPKTEEGRIIQIADKVSFINPKLVSLILKYSLRKSKQEKGKDIRFIKEMVEEGLRLLERF